MNDMEQMSEVKSKAISIVRNYMGDTTAQSYAGFYATEDDATVLESIRKLLTEYVGASQAEEILIQYGLLKKTNL